MGSVLVVDDTRSVRAALARIIRRAGYQVFEAEVGHVALEIARREELVAAVVDYQMPEMDGLTLLARLRKASPGAARLLVSGALDIDVVMEAVNRGEVSRVLHKPVSAPRLIAALDQAIRSRDVHGEAWLAKRDAGRQSRRAALETLLETRNFALALQPIVDHRTRRPVAFECLLRSRCEQLDRPDKVIRAAEDHGRIGALAAAVAEVATAHLERLPEDLDVFVNMHPLELRDPDHLFEAYAPLVPHASRVVLEITERSSAMAQGDWHKSVAGLRSLGFRIAVDDLGAGAASLSVLAEVDPDIIKLDLSLVRGVDASPRKRRLIQMLCRFAEATGVQVVGEGVESHQELKVLVDLGVDMLQGFHLARPLLEVDDVDAVLDQRLPLAPTDGEESSKRSGTRRRAGAVLDLRAQRRKKAK